MSRAASSDRPAGGPVDGTTGHRAHAGHEWADPARATVRRAFAELEPAPGALLWLQLSAPLLPIDSALAALRRAAADDDDELLWDPPAGAAFAGRGAAATIRGTDLARARAEAAAILDGLHDMSATVPGGGGPPPRWFGALAFDDRAEERLAPWRDFGGGRLVLPRARYLRSGESAFVGFAILVGRDGRRAGRGPEIDAIERVIDQLAGADGYEPGPHRGRTIVETPRAHWNELVEEILAGIAGGRFHKVVAARRTEVSSAVPGAAVAGPPIDALDVVARLRAGEGGCTRFLLGTGATSFVGATPERLIAKHGDRVTTQALAGSIGAAVGDASSRLLASAKDRAEHAMVVDEIARRLGPWCEPLALPSAPRVRTLPHLLHLDTPIEGRLRRPAHVLDLVGALHPTPAVGGLPAEAALDWIAEREGAGRGLYAGPVGWFDAAGDGEFVVALRSAALSGDHAWLWVGAGIVAGSDAEREYDETALKQRGMLAAIVGEP